MNISEKKRLWNYMNIFELEKEKEKIKIKDIIRDIMDVINNITKYL